jgi:hypothetical protein
MILLFFIFTGKDNLRRNLREGFFGCNRVPGTAKLSYEGPRVNNYIDKMCSDNPEDAPYNKDRKWLAWPCYGRKNYSKPLPGAVGGERVHKEMKGIAYQSPFKFDGVWSVGESGDKCSWS